MADISGSLATLEYSTDGTGSGGGAWTAISKVISYKFPHPKGEKIKTTGLSDTVQTAIPGIPDPGSFSATIKHSTANKTLICTTLYQTLYFYRLKFSDGTGESFPAFLSEYEAPAEFNTLAAWDVTFEICGAITVI